MFALCRCAERANTTKLGYSRTNIISEGWNNKFQHLNRFKHPLIYIIIEALQMMNL